MSCDSLDQPCGGIEFESDLFISGLGQILVSVGMVADFMAFAGDALQQIGILLHLGAEHEEGCRSFLCLENFQNLRCPGWIRAVIKGKCYFVRTGISLPGDAFRKGKLDVAFNKTPVVMEIQMTLPWIRILADIDEITTSGGGDLLIQGNSGKCGKFLGIRQMRGISTKEIPDGRIFLAETVKSNSSRMIGCHGAAFVEEADGIHKPNFMLLILIRTFEIVEVRRVIGGIDKLRFYLGLGRPRHDIREGEGFDCMVVLSPVIGIDPHADDPLVGIAINHHCLQPAFKPGPVSQRPRISRFGILIVQSR